jgi:Protein of unknown function (DUF2721)
MPEVIVSHAIELAITPVFLLVGITGLLNVMSTRLARVVDRARYVQQSFSNLHEQARALACTEITHLGRMRRLASWAINFCTAGALLVCLIVVPLFVDDLFVTDLRVLAGALFVCALAALIGGLTCFLRELYLAMHLIDIETARFEHKLPVPNSRDPQ